MTREQKIKERLYSSLSPRQKEILSKVVAVKAKPDAEGRTDAVEIKIELIIGMSG